MRRRPSVWRAHSRLRISARPDFACLERTSICGELRRSRMAARHGVRAVPKRPNQRPKGDKGDLSAPQAPLSDLTLIRGAPARARYRNAQRRHRRSRPRDESKAFPRLQSTSGPVGYPCSRCSAPLRQAWSHTCLACTTTSGTLFGRLPFSRRDTGAGCSGAPPIPR